MNDSAKVAAFSVMLFLVETAVFFWLFQKYFAVYALIVILFLFTFLGYATSKQKRVRLAVQISLGAIGASAVFGFAWG